jgi:RimJ/RimL family protein N-acetyltransferase
MLHGSKIYLAVPSEEDFLSLFKWINERDTVIFGGPYRPVSLAQHRQWFDSVCNASDRAFFMIYDANERVPVGSCQLHSIHPVHRSAELQIRIGEKSKRNSGYGTEAVRLLLGFAFSDLNLHRVYLHVLSGNERALSLYRKLGFVEEGVLRQAAFIDGKYTDLCILAILRDERT